MLIPIFRKLRKFDLQASSYESKTKMDLVAFGGNTSQVCRFIVRFAIRAFEGNPCGPVTLSAV